MREYMPICEQKQVCEHKQDGHLPTHMETCRKEIFVWEAIVFTFTPR